MRIIKRYEGCVADNSPRCFDASARSYDASKFVRWVVAVPVLDAGISRE